MNYQGFIMWCTKYNLFRDWILLVCFSWRYEVTEGPRVNFVMCGALFEIYTWILCHFIPPWETNKKNSILIFILYQNCTVLVTKYPFFNTKHPVIILRTSLFVVTLSHVASSKNGRQNFSYVYRNRKHYKCKYIHITVLSTIYMKSLKWRPDILL